MSQIARSPVPRIESLRVENYRALKELSLEKITPLTVLLGPNGSGKSTVFDVFAFLSECFQVGLRKAWDKRGRFRELRSRGADGPIVFELQYREKPRDRLITYRLSIDEEARGPIVTSESLRWKRGAHGEPWRFLDFKRGEGEVVSGEQPDEHAERSYERLDSPDLLAGQMYAAGGKLGHLWTEGFFDVGDPLVRHGGPANPEVRRRRTR